MVKDDLLDISAVPRRKIIGIDFFQIKALTVEPILTFSLPFPAMDMDRFITLIQLEFGQSFLKHLQQLISFTVSERSWLAVSPGLNTGLRCDDPDDLGGNVC